MYSCRVRATLCPYFIVKGPRTGIFCGIFVRDGANANIHDNAILDIRDEPLTGAGVGRGIVIGWAGYPPLSGVNTTGTATITNNVVTGYERAGIVVFNAGSSATISDNTVTSAAQSLFAAQTGIAIAEKAVGTISGNLCNHADCGPDVMTQFQATGISLFLSGGGITVSDNTVSNNDIGIYNWQDSSATVANTISGNSLTGNRYYGIGLDQGNATVSNNIINGGNVGVVIVSFNSNAANSQGTLTGNTITGVGRGIQLLDENSIDAEIPTMTANSNNIFGNTTFGVENTTTNLVNAENNWWGDASGPNDPTGTNEVPPCTADPTTEKNADGTGNGVSDNVDYCPWATSPFP